MSMNRAVLFHDASIFATHTDFKSLYLDSSGLGYMQINAQAKVTKHTTTFATQSDKCVTKLSNMLKLRNLVTSKNVLTSQRLSHPQFETSVQHKFAHWPLVNLPSPGEKINDNKHLSVEECDRLVSSAVKRWPEHIFRIADGSTMLLSTDKSTSISVAPHGQLIRVVFPALVHEDVRLVCDDKHDRDKIPKVERVYTYTHVHQLFPRDCVPSLWDYPLRLVTAASQVFDLPIEGSTDAVLKSQQDYDAYIHAKHVSSALPTVEPITKHDAVSDAVPLWAHSQDDLLKMHTIEGGLPRDEILWCEWTPEAMYWVCPTTAHGKSDFMVIILVHADDSVLVSSPSSAPVLMFTHYIRRETPLQVDGKEDEKTCITQDSPFVRIQQYEASAVPLRFLPQARSDAHQDSTTVDMSDLSLSAEQSLDWSVREEGAYALSSLTDHAVQLLSSAQDIILSRISKAEFASLRDALVNAQNTRTSIRPSPKHTQSAIHPLPKAALDTSYTALYHASQTDIHIPFSTKVHAEKHITGVGFFTAFVDRRVRVRFTDRTILEVNNDQSRAQFLLKDGTQLCITLPITDDSMEAKMELPADIEAYYLPNALEYANTAFLSKVEMLEIREEARLRSHVVEAELNKTDVALRVRNELELELEIPVFGDVSMINPDASVVFPEDDANLFHDIDRLLAMNFRGGTKSSPEQDLKEDSYENVVNVEKKPSALDLDAMSPAERSSFIAQLQRNNTRLLNA